MLYENIKKVAGDKGVSINRVEKDLNFGKAVISKWDKHRPSIDKVVAVAKYLGVPIEKLIEDEEDG